ncbi:UbiA family prenyltransferase [Corallincola platygyrae]|uniref:UbiA family prenyltransferase n=1 Tax=Corallincola platygyrae TaxID=1193278 RepID=A0ABW4XME1_9GAMM
MKFKPWLQLIRLPNGFSAISNVVAAFLIATQANGDIGQLFILVCASLCFFHGGMVLNDCFDFKEDSRERPSRPLPSGAIKQTNAWKVGFGLLVCGLGLCYLLGKQSFYIGLALAINIVLYDAIRHQGWLAALLMGGCRYLNWLLGLSVIELSPLWALLPLPLLAYIVAVTLLSQQETKASSPNKLWQVALALSVSQILLVALWFGQTVHGYLFLLMSLSAWLMLMLKLRYLYQNFTPKSVKQQVIMLLKGIVPFDALLLIAAGLPLAALALLLLMLPGGFLAKRIYMT